MNAVRGLKLLVAVMAILIVGGLGLLGYGVYSKLGGNVKSDASDAAPSAQAAVPPPAAAPEPERTSSSGDVTLDQPPGSRIADAATVGGLMTVRVEGGGRNDRVAVIDLSAGRVVGWVHVGSAGGEATTEVK
jgi:hypothetical protein